MFIIFIALYVLVSGNSVVFAENLPSANVFSAEQTGDEKFDKTFREGRELIDKEDWKQAAEKFKAIVCDCPEKKYVDAAFYWLAFSYKKLKMYGEMDETIARLQKNFPNSSWVDDALVMSVRLAPMRVPLATVPDIRAVSGNVTTSAGYPVSSNNMISGQFSVFPGVPALSAKVPLDREEEIKLAAFKSLFASDSTRAVGLSEALLKADSKATENLKIQIVRMMTSPRIIGEYSFYTENRNTPPVAVSQNTVTVNTDSLTTSAQSSAPAKSTVFSFWNPKLREVLSTSYQNNPSVNLKKEIIFAYGRMLDTESFDDLARLYNSETDRELRKTALQAFGNSSYYLRSPRTVELRKATVGKLLEILKSEQDAELKQFALNSLQGLSSWAKDDEKNALTQTLLQIYDNSNSESFKISVISVLAGSRENAATKKLMDIAKNAASDKLRIAAINSLQNNKSPEVMKFLEDLIN